MKYWPVAVDIGDDGQLHADDVHAWLRLMQDLPVTPFAIPVDEPHGHDTRMKLRHIFEVMGKAGGSTPRLLRAVTAHPSPELEGVTDAYFDGREGGWTYNGHPPDSGNMILDSDGNALRTWGWVAWRRKYTLWYAWEGLYFSDRYNHRGPTDVLHDPLTFQQAPPDDDRGNGDGILAYPGPLPSLRLKALRRGLLDRLLLQKLESCGGEARPFYDRLFNKDGWVAGEAPWEEARGRILDELVKRCPDALPESLPSWIAEEDGLRGAWRELVRLARRAASRPVLTLGLTLALSVGMVVRAWRKAPVYESHAVFRVTEGELDLATASAPNRALKGYIQNVVFSNEALVALLQAAPPGRRPAEELARRGRRVDARRGHRRQRVEQLLHGVSRRRRSRALGPPGHRVRARRSAGRIRRRM